jgi:hypothetical protein
MTPSIPPPPCSTTKSRTPATSTPRPRVCVTSAWLDVLLIADTVNLPNPAVQSYIHELAKTLPGPRKQNSACDACRSVLPTDLIAPAHSRHAPRRRSRKVKCNRVDGEDKVRSPPPSTASFPPMSNDPSTVPGVLYLPAFHSRVRLTPPSTVYPRITRARPCGPPLRHGARLSPAPQTLCSARDRREAQDDWRATPAARAQRGDVRPPPRNPRTIALTRVCRPYPLPQHNTAPVAGPELSPPPSGSGSALSAGSSYTPAATGSIDASPVHMGMSMSVLVLHMFAPPPPPAYGVSRLPRSAAQG